MNAVNLCGDRKTKIKLNVNKDSCLKNAMWDPYLG